MSTSLNGHHAPDPPAALRLTWFGQSVISDWTNPIATTVRATMRALQNAGHQVVFLEPRNSEPLVSALAARGSAMYRDFLRFFPDLHYRTYDMPRRAERDVWLSREAALVDAVIIQSDAPAEIFEWLERVPDSPMVRVLIALDASVERLDLFDLVLSPASVGVGERFEPAVLEGPPVEDPRAGTIVAAYSEFDPAALAGIAADIVAVGAAADVLPFVSEAALSERYQSTEKVIVVDGDQSPFAAARAMLPVAAGAETVRLDEAGTPIPVETFVDASKQAATLAQMIRDARARIRIERAPGAPRES